MVLKHKQIETMEITINTSFGTKQTITLNGDELKVFKAFKTEKAAQTFFDLYLYSRNSTWDCALELASHGHYTPQKPFPSIQWLESCECSKWEDFVECNFDDWYTDETGVDPERLPNATFDKDTFMLSTLARGYRWGSDKTYIRGTQIINQPKTHKVDLSDYIFEDDEFVIIIPKDDVCC